MKAIDESFDLFKDTTGSSKNWLVKESILPPADAPWHDGAIRYAKEKGYWNDEAQKWHDARLARLVKVQETWDNAIEEFNTMRANAPKDGPKINVKEAWSKFWEEARQKHLN